MEVPQTSATGQEGDQNQTGESRSLVKIAHLATNPPAELPGNRILRKKFTSPCANADLTYSHFQDCDGKGILFQRCNFTHCVFERCYFRNAKFENCDFTGARFIDCNLKEAVLITCKLEYSSYRGTLLERVHFASNLPVWENVRRDVARSLRMNAHGLGDQESVNFFINVEMDATLEHWWRAFRQEHSYYQQKYKGGMRLMALLKYWYYRLDRAAWGHGEKPLRIVRNVFFLLAIASVLQACSNLANIGGSTIRDGVTAILGALKGSASLFLGIDLADPAASAVPWGMKALLVSCRYVSIALFLGVLTKRLSRR